jgi:hypothetical protein
VFDGHDVVESNGANRFDFAQEIDEGDAHALGSIVNERRQLRQVGCTGGGLEKTCSAPGNMTKRVDLSALLSTG